MKITFACPGCGKKLKSRDGEVGRTRKCPVCTTRVTCPEPVVGARYADADVLEAEVVEAEMFPSAPGAPTAARRGARNGAGGGLGAAPSAPQPAPAFNPFADVDEDPYQLADPDPVPTSTAEPKKPCPMCGEVILASAVKCRYCGEVFDPKLKKGASKKKRKSSGGGSDSAGPRDIGIGVLCMVLGIGLTVATLAMASSNDNGGGRFFVFYGLIIGGFVQMCRGFYNMIRG